MFKKYFGILVVLIFALSLFGCGGGSSKSNGPQPTAGTISGVVKDTSGNPIVGADIIANNISTKSNEKGQFLITVASGSHEVRMSATGCNSWIGMVNVQTDKISNIEITLDKLASNELPFNGIGEDGNGFASYLNDQPPKIYQVNQSVISPNQPVTITTEIANDIEKTDYKTIEAYLSYSVDNGNTWARIKMDHDPTNEKNWTVSIPAFPSGTKVIYFLSARDTAGNLTTEIPGFNLIWPPDSSKLTLFVPDGNNSQTFDDLDILGFAVGTNDNTIFVALKVRGEIADGSLSPAQINTYAFGCLNPNKGEDILKGTVCAYAPLSQQLDGTSAFGIDRPAYCIDQRFNQTRMVIPYDEAGQDAIAVGNILYYKFNKTLIGEITSGVFKCIALTGYANTSDIETLVQGTGAIPCDASPYIYVYLQNHSYSIP